MPNHVHLPLTPRLNLSSVLKYIKGASARRANQILSTPGSTFWQGESFDRLIRNGDEFHKVEKYTLNNPVKVDLAATPEAGQAPLASSCVRHSNRS